MPTHSAEQWSTATNTATWPCSTVKAAVMSVPHIVSTGLGDDRAVVGARAAGAARRGSCAERPFSRISRRTRSFEVRRPAWRSRAQTLR